MFCNSIRVQTSDGVEIKFHSWCYRRMKARMRNEQLELSKMRSSNPNLQTSTQHSQPVALEAICKAGGTNAVADHQGAFVYTHIPGPLTETGIN